MNAFTSTPPIKLRASKYKRPDLAPRNSGITLGDHRAPVERAAVGAMFETRADAVTYWKRRAGKK